MKKYELLEMQIYFTDNNDVITTSDEKAKYDDQGSDMTDWGSIW